MTDKEITFVLDCYKADALVYKDGHILMDSNAMIAIAEFIEQQKAEIKALQNALDYEGNELRCARELANGLKAEVEFLKQDAMTPLVTKIGDEVARREKIKAEAVREFAEQVKMAFYYQFDELIPSIMADKIDELVKEMVGDNDEMSKL